MYRQWFGPRDNDNWWWCGGSSKTVAQTQKHLLLHCSRCRDQQKTFWNEVGKATGWRAGRCRHIQVSEPLSMEMCNTVVMDILIATEIGKFLPNRAMEEEEQELVGSP